MRKANYISFITTHIKEFRSPLFYDNLVYVTTRLRAEHDPALGVSGLPPESRAAFLGVAYLYQSFAWLFELKVLHTEPAVQLIARRLRIVWTAIKPYVEVERRLVPGPFFELLERVAENLLTVEE